MIKLQGVTNTGQPWERVIPEAAKQERLNVTWLRFRWQVKGGGAAQPKKQIEVTCSIRYGFHVVLGISMRESAVAYSNPRCAIDQANVRSWGSKGHSMRENHDESKQHPL